MELLRREIEKFQPEKKWRKKKKYTVAINDEKFNSLLQSIHSAYLFDSILSKILISKLVKIKKGSESTPINSFQS